MNRISSALLGLLCALFLLVVPAGASAADIEGQNAIARIHSATLEADINPLGESTSCQAQYVDEGQFQASGFDLAKTVPCEPADLGSGTSAVSATVALTDLEIDTTYRYRFLAGGEPGPEQAFATFGFEGFSFEILDQGGEPEARAGSHPFRLIATATLTSTDDAGLTSPTGVLKDLLNELPPGLVGSAAAVPRCSARMAEEQRCSGDSQVGRLWISHGATEFEGPAPLFSVVPPRGKAARFVSSINLSTGAFIDASVRTGDDYGITAGGYNVTHLANPYAVKVEMWGVPASAAHDALRSCPRPSGKYDEGCASYAPEEPFLTMPSECAGPLTVTGLADAYGSPGEWVGASAGLSPVSGCDALEFEPRLEARPTTDVADSPTGLHVDLRVPQSEDPESLATANLRDAVVKLPPGLTVNPASAAGLQGCTPDQLGLTTPVGTSPIHTTPGPARCPDAAKIGSVEVDTPLLDHPLSGAVYLAEPYQNPFGSLLAIYIAVHDPASGVVIKLAGHVELGPEGQLTTSFDENPQLPFEDFKLDFFAGPRAALRTPATCGRYETASVLTPWSAPESGPPATPRDSYEIVQAPGGGSCPTSAAAQPNSPSFQAGTESPLAGAFSPFVLNLRREDGSQTFRTLDVTPPPGLLGKLAGTPYCPDSALAAAASKGGAEEQASASCPPASQVGTVDVGAGAGPSPYAVQGRAYLAGPYKGAPLSLAIVTPAVAGPYDLGTVVVRSALSVDPTTTQITVKSDPIPAELKGIPLDLRSIGVKIDRSDFTLNPTSCEAMSVTGAATSNQGGTAPLANRFQVGECAKLGFKPKLGLRLFGASRRGGAPRFRAALTMPAGGANIARAQVALPHSEFLNQAHIRTICTRVQYAAGAGHGSSCPSGSVYGYARAWSPLLDQPLRGPVYLRSSSNPLPDLVAALRGQIDVDLVGRIDSHKGGIRNTFDVVPDARVSRFVLTMRGGKKGLLENSTNICRGVHRATAKFVGQNGKVTDLKPKMRAKCPRRKAGRRHAGHRRGR